MKKIFKISFIIVGIFLLIICIGIGWTVYIFAPNKVEVGSAWTRDNSTCATITEVNGGTRNLLGYEIKIQNKNQIFSFSHKVAYLYGAERSDCASGVDLEWESTEVLLIKYLKANDTNLYSEKVDIGGRTITVKLVPNVTNSSAPCGAMEKSPNKSESNLEYIRRP